MTTKIRLRKKRRKPAFIGDPFCVMMFIYDFSLLLLGKTIENCYEVLKLRVTGGHRA